MRVRATDIPRNGVGVEQVREEAADVAQFVSLETVDGRVLLLEDLLQWRHVLAVDHAEALGQQSEELLVRALLSATVQHHVAQLHLTAEKQNNHTYIRIIQRKKHKALRFE